MNEVLAIGNSGLYEFSAFNAVVGALKKRSHNALLFKQDNCLKGEYLTFEVRNGVATYKIIIDGIKYDISNFSAIWYLKPQLPRQLIEYPDADFRGFIHKQFFAMREALWNLLSDKKWINDPWADYKAENKLFQLKVASTIGMLVPDTLITSDSEMVRSFYTEHNGEIIVKLLATSPILNKVIYTNRVTDEYISKIDSLKMSPAIFQPVVPKEYELRITVVGDKIFPVRIFSQVDEATALDWRKKPLLNDYSVKMEQTLLPENIERKIKKLMNELGLKFGCIDMIVTPDGQYVFLEINPNGQWYFVQLRTEAQIAEAIADLLIV